MLQGTLSAWIEKWGPQANRDHSVPTQVLDQVTGVYAANNNCYALRTDNRGGCTGNGGGSPFRWPHDRRPGPSRRGCNEAPGWTGRAPLPQAQHTFADEDISLWAQSAIGQVQGAGIMNGTGG